ncbi:hypothetical protein FDP41_001071 [Naegleria fowleri]|uniref:Methyltransferase domain-containing protein n=1 Tax=Naegleria fowleri TaxID=5763 RepID=A0A6A5C1Z1_NAEFO|nr:uncharacterized protein FDP41_001071 [Naegleria fowleri]KAF0979918.1 hypothetical protein FDP41_001071 [Naegleria fowleri]
MNPKNNKSSEQPPLTRRPLLLPESSSCHHAIVPNNNNEETADPTIVMTTKNIPSSIIFYQLLSFLKKYEQTFNLIKKQRITEQTNHHDSFMNHDHEHSQQQHHQQHAMNDHILHSSSSSLCCTTTTNTTTTPIHPTTCNTYNNTTCNTFTNNNTTFNNEEEKIVDFFIFDHFNTTIPKDEWKEQLLSMSTSELIEMSQYHHVNVRKDSSLNDFVNECKQLMDLIVTSMSGNDDHTNQDSNNNSSSSSINNTNNTNNTNNNNNNNNSNNNNHHFMDGHVNNKRIRRNNKKSLSSNTCLLEKGLNIKKKYEIEILSQLIRNLSKQYHINSICDIGGGQGYLTQKILIDQELEKWNSNNNHLNINSNNPSSNINTNNNHLNINSNNSNYSSNLNSNHISQISHIYTIDCNHYLTQNATKRIKMIRRVLNNQLLRRESIDSSLKTDKCNDHHSSCEYKAITSHLSFTLNDEEFSKIVQELELTLSNENTSNNNTNYRNTNSINNNNSTSNNNTNTNNNTNNITNGYSMNSLRNDNGHDSGHEQLHHPHNDRRLVLIGLHTCGSLASSMIKLFLASNKCHAMINIGCCYHKLCEGQSFPLSSSFYQQPTSQFTPIYLSNLGKSMACLNPYIWNSKDLKSCQEQFRLKSYRYAFQYLLYQWMGYDAIKNLIIRQPSRTNSIVSFGRFTFYTLQNLLQDYPELKNHEIFSSLSFMNNQELFEKTYNDYYSKEFQPCPHTDIVKKVEACWFFRSLIGPLLECYILLDRLIYLQMQQEIPLETAYLKRIFDPSLSPRGFVLVAVKKIIQ